MKLGRIGLTLAAIALVLRAFAPQTAADVATVALLLTFLALMARGVFSVRSSLIERTVWRSTDPDEKNVALTFDDGPHPEHTPQVLDALEASQATATFFLVGKNVREHPELAKRIVAAGHEVACHADSHLSSSPWFRPARIDAEIRDSLGAIHVATGVTPRLYRPPFAITTPPQAGVPAKHGLVVVGMARRGLDRNPGMTCERLVARTVGSARGGEVLALHDGDEPRRSATRCLAAEALPGIVAGLAERGLGTTKVSALISERPYRETHDRGWTGQMYGGRIGLLIALRLLRIVGLRVALWIVYPAIIGYLLLVPSARRASIAFRRRLQGPSSITTEWAWAFRQFTAYGRMMVDWMHLSIAPRKAPQVEWENLEGVQEALAEPGGLLLVSAHHGDYIAPSRLLETRGRKLWIVAYRGAGLGPHQVRRDAQSAPYEVIDVDQPPTAIAMEMIAALRQKGVVALLGDRLMGAPGVKVPFCGADVEFPTGPWSVAMMTGTPVLVFFAIPLGIDRVRMCAYGPIRLRKPTRDDREDCLREAVSQYAGFLEDCVRRHPHHWANFYDFWAAS